MYLCSNCGNEFPKWSGQCQMCKDWNTLKEYNQPKGQKKSTSSTPSKIHSLDTITPDKKRIETHIQEFDQVLSGGIVTDSFILLTGDPGIGKSTLAMQVSLNIADTYKVLYFSAEESIEQIASRARRIKTKSSQKKLKENFLLTSENILENILESIQKNKPQIIIIDSIQTISSDNLDSNPGTLSQIRFCTESIMQFIKNQGIACLLIGHINKSGDMAGPQTLAHLVDTVLYFEGDNYHQFRMLRSQKNRFGSTSNIGIFEMEEDGLHEVKNPSKAFLEGRQTESYGSVVIPTIEGTRPILIELQALSNYSHFGYPKRTASGIDVNRLHLMIAVLQKYGNIKMDNLDVFVNVIGGLCPKEPAIDLGLLISIASSKAKHPLKNDLVVIGEVGLTGEIRSVSHAEKRLKEAKKLGFNEAIIPSSQKNCKTDIKLLPVASVAEVLKLLDLNSSSKNK